MSHVEDAVAMPPPPTAIHTDNQTKDSMSASFRFPSNAYAPATSEQEYTPRASQDSVLQSTPIDIPANRAPAPLHESGQLKSPGQQQPSSTSPTSDCLGSPTRGAKRTANGGIKSPYSPYFSSSEFSQKPFHSRNMSMETTVSSVGELSAQLKSRLSHAMNKIHVDMERRSAAQISPPNSAKSWNTNGFSPRASMTDTHRHSRTLSQIVNGTGPQGPYLVNTAHNRDTTSESYERGQPIPALAPAADLKTNSFASRRSNSTNQPPKLLTNTQAGNPDSRLNLNRAETPTQQEQDAVDTLLFMSSPANSGRYPRDSLSAHASPRTADFARFRAMRSLPNGAPNLARMTSTSSDEFVKPAIVASIDKQPSKRRNAGHGMARTELDVDRMLDRMAAETSSGSEDGRPLVHSPSTHRTYAHGVSGVHS